MADSIETLDFAYVNPDELEDTGTDIEAARKDQLANEAINTAVQAWLAEKHAATDARRADAITVPDFTGDDPDDDPHAEQRAERERLQAGADAQAAQAATARKSFERKRARLRDAGVTITAADLKKAKRQFLVGTGDGQGDGYLQRLEREFIAHRNQRRRGLAALDMSGTLALNESERAAMAEQVANNEAAMATLKAVIDTYRGELLDAGGSLPAPPPTTAPAKAAKAAAKAAKA